MMKKKILCNSPHLLRVMKFTFLFNNDRKYQIISDQGIAADGTITRYPTLKSPQKGYEFMPSLSKQVGARQIIIPCAYRNNICFAKVDF
ncbi:MAG: hypothetical protein IPO01_00360 [Chitinophagaceae bacterium]|nr:hypothetical protein [Chitinophagaceae bacterium]